MISVEQATQQVLDLFSPLEREEVSLENAGGRTLARDVTALRDQPPFSSSAMDGYAVLSSDVKKGATLNVIGEAAAGKRFKGNIKKGEAVRIFTGAPVPTGSDRIVIQEDCERIAEQITFHDNLDSNLYIRPLGGDFKKGSVFKAPKTLGASDISLLAAMNAPRVTVTRKPVIAFIATGDELVAPGKEPNEDQIVSSNNYALKALVESNGAIARLLPIARDSHASLQAIFNMALDADLIVTLGGASVGDHDLIHKVATDLGLKTSFYKVAMRPGKPLMAGKIGKTPMIGLPGNPVSALVCGHIFLRPVIFKMLGLKDTALDFKRAPLKNAIPRNGARAHFMRARLENGSIEVFDTQDSSLISVISQSNCLALHQVNAHALNEGEMIEFLEI